MKETELNAYREKLKRYYDESGRLIQYPSKRTMRLLALTHIADRLDTARKYTEKEINEIIKESIAFGDIELIRREMFQHKLIGFNKDYVKQAGVGILVYGQEAPYGDLYKPGK